MRLVIKDGFCADSGSALNREAGCQLEECCNEGLGSLAGRAGQGLLRGILCEFHVAIAALHFLLC